MEEVKFTTSMDTYIKNKEELIEQLSEVISYSQNIPRELIHVDKILDDWYKNKKHFIQLFHNQFIYECPEPITFTLDKNSKRNAKNKFELYIQERVENNYSFLKYICYLSVNEFFNNLTDQDYIIDDIIIPKGNKVVKSFKYFINNIDLLKEVQSEASRVIQSNSVTGTLCFSVHPLDFLSISENDCGWRSCHSLDGDYRAGNLNYMVDNVTFICYLKTNKAAVLPHFPDSLLWNSKIWRVLLYMTEDRAMLFAGKPYPFLSNEGLNICLQKLNEINKNFSWKENWIDEQFSTFSDSKGTKFYLDNMIPVGNVFKRLTEVIQNNPKTLQFNDLLQSSSWYPHWTYKENYWLDNGTGCSNDMTTVLRVGKPCRCPICQQEYIVTSDIMACLDCSNTYQIGEAYQECEMCGNLVPPDELFYLNWSGMLVCQHCYETELYQCDVCGISDIGAIVKYHDYDNQCLCPDCWNEKLKLKENVSEE